MQAQKKLIAALAVAGALTLAGCGGGDFIPVPNLFPDYGTPTASTVTIDFNNGIDGWSTDVADYTDHDRPTEVASAWKDLPAPLSGKGYYMISHNNSDDVLTYARRQLDGLVKHAKYRVTFEMRYATDAATGCMGVGGSRGESVWMVASASFDYIKTMPQPNGNYRVNIDRGNQAASGPQGKVLGTQGVEGLSCSGGKWASTTRKSSEAVEVHADKDGRIWIMLGTDSGFEGTNAVYLQGATIHITPV